MEVPELINFSRNSTRTQYSSIYFDGQILDSKSNLTISDADKVSR